MEQEYLQELFSFQAGLQFSNDAGLFKMEPAEGAKVLSSYGLYFKPTDNGFTIAAPFIGHPDTGLMELKNQFDDDVKLSIQTNNSLYPFQPEKVKVMNLDPITFTSAQKEYDKIPKNRLKIMLELVSRETSENAAKLRANMEQLLGKKLNPGEHAHHIVPSTHSYPSAEEARKI